MLIRLHDKLARRIGLRPVESLPLCANPILDWSCQLFRAERADYVIALNTAALYAAILPARGLQAEAPFRARMLAYLRAALMADGFEFHYKRFLDPELPAVHYSRPFMRTPATALSDLVEVACHDLEVDARPPEEVAAAINATPLAVLDQRSPREAFRGIGFRA